jgi:hypothetical protein
MGCATLELLRFGMWGSPAVDCSDRSGTAKHLTKPSHKNHWIRSLRADGLDFEIVTLQRCETEAELNKAERWWITVGFAALGKRFTNVADGGEGGRRQVPTSEEHRAKLAEASRRRYDDPEQRRQAAENARRQQAQRLPLERRPRLSCVSLVDAIRDAHAQRAFGGGVIRPTPDQLRAFIGRRTRCRWADGSLRIATMARMGGPRTCRHFAKFCKNPAMPSPQLLLERWLASESKREVRIAQKVLASKMLLVAPSLPKKKAAMIASRFLLANGFTRTTERGRVLVYARGTGLE